MTNGVKFAKGKREHAGYYMSFFRRADVEKRLANGLWGGKYNMGKWGIPEFTFNLQISGARPIPGAGFQRAFPHPREELLVIHI
jgi:hypothetical protein